MKPLKLTLRETFTHWRAQNPARMSASLSYFAIFSMVPLFLIMIELVGVFFGSDFVEKKLLHEISNMVGSDITGYIRQLLSRHEAAGGGTIVPAIIGFLVLMFGATGVFREIRYSLNKIWMTDTEKKIRGIKGLKQILLYIKKHAPILLLIIVLSALFLASIVSGLSMQVIGNYLESIFPNTYGLIQMLEPLVSFVFVTLFFGSIYKVLPKTKLPWQEIAFGASVTAIVFLIGELVIGYYLGHFMNRSLYGAAGSLISVMLWVYFSSQVFFLGAAFTFTYSKRYGYLKRKV